MRERKNSASTSENVDFELHTTKPNTDHSSFFCSILHGMFLSQKYTVFLCTCFNSFVRSAVDAKSHSDKIPNSGAIAETVKLLTKSSYLLQTIYCSWHTVTKCLRDEKTHAAFKSQSFKKLDRRIFHCMKFNLPNHILNTRNQCLSGSFSSNTQNCDY